ncbi:MAG TPA: aldehyde:ferredoxin oxidoreductase, partial [Candidatus Wirthbacteria bacterium]|nr:aldehyde:ferredoxin oxidoreductase [Candidatus Wirthbacteria bacterium]
MTSDKQPHQIIKTFHYQPAAVVKGYTDQILHINISDYSITPKSVDPQMKKTFIGGRGYGLKLLWDATTPQTNWNDPENEIIINTGPLCGTTQYPGMGKSLVVGLSPLTNSVMDSNVGGFFGPYLKFSGWDSLEIQGKSAQPVIIFIDGNQGEIRIEQVPKDLYLNSHLICEDLTEFYATNQEDKQNLSVVAAGQGAVHSNIGCLNFSYYDRRRQAIRLKQAGRGGLGTVLSDKNVLALVARYRGTKGDSNQPANLETIKQVGIKMHKQIHDYDHIQCHMRRQGTAHLVEVMSDYDLLPTRNFQYGGHEDAKKIASWVWDKKFSQGKPDGCWYGCSMSCAHCVENFELQTGPYAGQKVLVDGPEYENAAGLGSNWGIFDPNWILEAN